MEGSDKGIDMANVLMTIAAIVMMGLIASSWYAIKAILTIKGDAAVFIRELESIHDSISKSEEDIANNNKNCCDELKLLKSDCAVNKIKVDMFGSELLHKYKDISTTIDSNFVQTDARIASECERLERNAEETSRAVNDYTNHSIADLRSYVDKRIDKSSDKTLHIDQTELVKSLKDLVMAFGKTK